MGHPCLPRRFCHPLPILDHQQISTPHFLEIHQPVHHLLVHGLPLRWHQLRHPHVFLARLRRTVVDQKASPSILRQVQLYCFRGPGWRDPSYGVHFDVCCFWWQWQGRSIPVSQPEFGFHVIIKPIANVLHHSTWAGNPDSSIHNLDYCMKDMATYD